MSKAEEIANIAETLEPLQMVAWDRFCKLGAEWSVYGWIERPQDAYKDFVVIDFRFDDVGVDISYVTSSLVHSDEIASKLGITPENHAKCQRMENTFQSLRCISG